MNDVIVDTDRGRVRGHQPDGVAVFLGIRYGAAPRGPLRFRPPVVEHRAGVTDALEFAPSSIQAPTSAGSRGPLATLRGPTPRTSMGEDCLALNVWSADLRGRAPVMVWLHGGGYTTGSGSGPSTNGANLARTHGVVVVSVNHRLGLLGFLDLSEALGSDFAESANVSLLDLVAALSWIRANIGSFGGNPGNVTIFGCSGGGGKAAALLAMPAARGLVHRAIVQSGPVFSFRDRERARSVTRRVLDHLGVAPRALLEVSTERLYEVQHALGAGGGPTEDGMAFSPTVDGVVLPAYPDDAFRAGASDDVPLIIGTNRDEARFALAAQPNLSEAVHDDDDVCYLVAPGFDGDPAPVVAWYRARHPELSSADLRLLIETEQFRIRSLRLADAKAEGGSAPVFCYRFDWSSSARPDWGAFHSLEVPFVFANTADGPALAADPSAGALSQAMSRAWTTFAATGRPATAGGAKWPPYRPPERPTIVIDDQWHLESDPMADERRAWNDELLSQATRPWGRLLATPEPRVRK